MTDSKSGKPEQMAWSHVRKFDEAAQLFEKCPLAAYQRVKVEMGKELAEALLISFMRHRAADFVESPEAISGLAMEWTERITRCQVRPAVDIEGCSFSCLFKGGKKSQSSYGLILYRPVW